MIKGKTIFLVDDDQDDRLFMGAALKNVIGDAEIIELENGIELLDLLTNKGSRQDPELILIDMNMPRMNGLETLTVLKQSADCRHIPVVMVSTTCSQQLISQAYKEGVSAFMVKPITMTDYDLAAQAVNVCFLNSYPSISGLKTAKKYKNKSIIVLEDNNDHWELMDFALKQSMPDVKAIRLKDKQDTVQLQGFEAFA